MRKEYFYLIFLLLLLAISLYAVSAKVEKHQGTIDVALADTSYGTYKTDKYTLENFNIRDDVVYDRIMAQIYFPDMSGNDTAIGNTDTLIVTWYMGWNYLEQAVQVDTANPPCTLTFNYYTFLPEDGDTSAAGTWLYGSDKKPYPLYDYFWFEIYVEDSASDTCTASATLQYFIKKFSF